MSDRKTRRVYVVLADTQKAFDCRGGEIHRFRRAEHAKNFAASATLYGKPATVTVEDVPVHLAKRWGVA